MKFKYCLSLDHDPGHPGIEYCQNNEQTNYRSLTKRDELNSHGKEKKYSRSKDVYWPLQTHVNKIMADLLLYDIFPKLSKPAISYLLLERIHEVVTLIRGYDEPEY